jgi:DNA-directed RNA polymerase specialized sigma24 family protein
MQDSFVRAIGHSRTAGNWILGAWLFRIVVNRCRTMRRRLVSPFDGGFRACRPSTARRRRSVAGGDPRRSPICIYYARRFCCVM